jgi:hypothetical protein
VSTGCVFDCWQFYLVLLIVVIIDNCDEFGDEAFVDDFEGLALDGICLAFDVGDVFVDLSEALPESRVELVLDAVLIFVTEFERNVRPLVACIFANVPT